MAPKTSAGLSKKSGGKFTSGMANGKGGPPSKLNSFVSSKFNLVGWILRASKHKETRQEESTLRPGGFRNS